MYKARDIANMSHEDLWKLPDGPMIIEFDDGLLETTSRETIFSAYLWVFVRIYPKTPLMVRHHIAGKRLGSNTHGEILGSLMFDCVDAYNDQLDIELLSKILYETVNILYNDFTYRLESYVSTISILDFIDVVEHPVIKKANESVLPNQNSIDHTYSVVTKILNSPTELIDNSVAKAAKSGLVSMGQILQCTSARGYLSDINSHIFFSPIKRGYVHGIRSLYDSMIESRSASKALMFAKDPLSAVEYFNRKMQFVAGTFKRIHKGDCGSTKYLPFDIHAGDLSSFEGKNYLAENGTIQRITRADRHLVGKTVLLRSVFYCNHPDNNGACSTCFGDLALSVPSWTNQGHVSSTILGERASQNVLSTKHLDGSSKVDDIEISEYDSLYIRTGDDVDTSTLKLASRLDGKHVYMTIASKEAKNLTDINLAATKEEIKPSRITLLTEVKIVVRSESGTEEATIPVSIGNRLSSLTMEMLLYLKVHGWNLTSTGDYEIDLEHWDIESPVFVLPQKHLSMVDHMKSVEKMIKEPTAKPIGRGKVMEADNDPAVVLLNLYKLVSTKLKMNIAHLEVILMAMMIESDQERKYNIPTNALSGEFGAYPELMRMRSMSALMAYQGQVTALLDPRSFISTDRSSHPLDALLMG